MSKYLLEIGVEEFPATYIEPTKNQLVQAFTKLLTTNGVDFHNLRCDATPRRFVVRIEGLHNKTEDKVEQVKGPAARIAFDESGKVSVVFFNRPYLSRDRIFEVGSRYRFYGKLTKYNNRLTLNSPIFEPYKEGIPLPEFVPIYPLTAGLK